MIDLNTVLFGTDAEVFLRTLKGEPFPVCGVYGGTKEKPKPLEVLGAGFMVQEDNAAVEFNTPPVRSISKFSNQIINTLNVLQQMLPQTLVFDLDHASLEFDDVYLQIPQMKRFGCEPDYNALTMEANDRPNCDNPKFRSAAAHVHIGWDNPTDDDRIELVKLCDVFAVCRYLVYEKEDEHARRKLYGKAGTFRPKPYGIEHRVKSNRWINSPSTIKKTLNEYVRAIIALNYGVKVDEADNASIMAAINTPDTNLATQIFEKYNAKLEHATGASGTVEHLLYSFR